MKTTASQPTRDLSASLNKTSGEKTQCTSISINKIARCLGVEPRFIASTGSGDEKLTLWNLGSVRAIETNGDPIFDESSPEDFEKALESMGIPDTETNTPAPAPQGHTPTPWVVSPPEHEKSSGYGINAPGLRSIATMNGRAWYGDCDMARENAANAALIVARVNGWDALVAERDALRAALDKANVALGEAEMVLAGFVSPGKTLPDGTTRCTMHPEAAKGVQAIIEARAALAAAAK